MKKTFTINISGSVFHIDEDAYGKLNNYLKMLKKHFGESQEGIEIQEDIEARIAELFNEKINKSGKHVIENVWVDEMIARMGNPEDFMDGEPDENGPEAASTVTAERIRRRMYRDPDYRVLGGVCGGMGAYFGIDPVVLRIVVFALFLISMGVMIPVYILLWIGIPKARTTAQKLEMQGREATVSNIEKTIKEGLNEVKAGYKKFKNSNPFGSTKRQAGQFWDVVSGMLGIVIKITSIFIGIFLILVGFTGLLSFLSSMIIGCSFLNSMPWLVNLDTHFYFYIPQLIDFFVSSDHLTILLIAIGFLVGIPLLAILFVGIKIVFRFQTNNKLIFLGAMALWLLSFFTAIIASAIQVDDCNKQDFVTETNNVNCNACNTLYLRLDQEDYKNLNHVRHMKLGRMEVISKNGDLVLLGNPQLNIAKSNTEDFEIQLRKRACGSNDENAKAHALEIVYQYKLNDSTIHFNPYYYVEDEGSWMQQQLDIVVKIPEGKRIYLDEELFKIMNKRKVYMLGKYWKMTSEGLLEENL